jgi:hypothetical protein
MQARQLGYDAAMATTKQKQAARKNLEKARKDAERAGEGREDPEVARIEHG